MDHTQKQSNRRAQWQSLVEKQEKSGLSQKEFCESHGIELSQFVYYRTIFKTKKLDEAKAGPLFTAVGIKTKDISSPIEVKIVLPNGFQCFVPSLITSHALKSMMEVLLSC